MGPAVRPPPLLWAFYIVARHRRAIFAVRRVPRAACCPCGENTAVASRCGTCGQETLAGKPPVAPLHARELLPHPVAGALRAQSGIRVAAAPLEVIRLPVRQPRFVGQNRQNTRKSFCRDLARIAPVPAPRDLVLELTFKRPVLTKRVILTWGENGSGAGGTITSTPWRSKFPWARGDWRSWPWHCGLWGTLAADWRTSGAAGALCPDPRPGELANGIQPALPLSSADGPLRIHLDQPHCRHAVGANKLVAGLAGGLFAWSVASSLWIYPHSLSYFNELTGGPRQRACLLGQQQRRLGPGPVVSEGLA